MPAVAVYDPHDRFLLSVLFDFETSTTAHEPNAKRVLQVAELLSRRTAILEVKTGITVQSSLFSLDVSRFPVSIRLGLFIKGDFRRLTRGQRLLDDRRVVCPRREIVAQVIGRRIHVEKSLNTRLRKANVISVLVEFA
jgi:hypothetical protein